MAKLTTAECAKLINVTNRTIQNKIKQGKLSAERDESGNYIIDSSEFLRVFPHATIGENRHEEVREDFKTKCQVLQVKVTMLETQNNWLQEQLKEAKEREKKLIDTISNTTKLLEHDSKKRKRILGIF